jgi:hypothetical protein
VARTGGVRKPTRRSWDGAWHSSAVARRTGPTLGLFLIGLALVPAGLAVRLADDVRGVDTLATALPSAGIVLMVCAAALVAAGRTPAMTEVRGLCWVFLVVALGAALLGNALYFATARDPLLLGVLLVAGVAVTVVLTLSPSRSRRQPRPFEGRFGLVLTAGMVLVGVAVLLWVLAGAVELLIVPALLLSLVAVPFLAASTALLAARRVAAVAPLRWLATGYLAAVYLLPFVVQLVLAQRSFDGIALWLLGLFLTLLTAGAAAAATATLAVDAANRRRPSRAEVSP